MKWVIGISFGELMLKGKNRMSFVEKSIKQIRKACRAYHLGDHLYDQGKLFIEAPYEEFDAIISKIKMVFGLKYVFPAIVVEKDYDELEEAAKVLLKDDESKTFKVKATRADKSFKDNSMEIAAEMGGRILKNFPNLKVDIKKPEKIVYVDIRKYAYVYGEKIECIGGLPMGTGGRALLLLSGGIDSPVAGFEMARRGVEIAAIHFHSYPFTSERAKDKVKRLAEQMSTYLGEFRLYNINLLNIYTAINKNCRPRFTTVLARRFMMRIGEIIARRDGFDGFVTGEALGQVASQTIQGISVVNDATSLPILRPLINMDKTEIIDLAKMIETYEISIEPYDDCCSFFAPDRPATKPRLNDILRDEENLDIDALVQDALDSMEIEYISLRDLDD
ncbi:MAG: tRNA uracil 4-sulfurtransferase ThiI [Tissierellia bacterium]|nr:tRNA uracil 4-sulfurtransferase ThiI [Tissierellia bacterium]